MFTTTALALPDSAVPESGSGFSLDAIMAASRALPIEVSLVILVLSVLNIVDAYRLARQRKPLTEGTTETDGETRCQHCGRETDPEFDFCQWCSEPLDGDGS